MCIYIYISWDWLIGKCGGKHPYVMEKTWFPVDFPLNQSIEYMIVTTNHIYQTPLAPRSGPARL